MTRDEFDRKKAWGALAYFGSDRAPVRLMAWFASGVRVRFSDGHVEKVHPNDLDRVVY